MSTWEILNALHRIRILAVLELAWLAQKSSCTSFCKTGCVGNSGGRCWQRPESRKRFPSSYLLSHTFFGQLRCNPRTLRFKASPVPTGLF
jgi:hypothetical protein